MVNPPPITQQNKGRVTSMSLWRRIQVRLICYLAYGLIRTLVATLRFEIVGKQHRQRAESLHPKSAFAIATWHQNAILGITGHRCQGICIMISASIDGEIISWIAGRFGLQSIRGSSSRGGREALIALLRYVRQGGQVAFTVDGPRGPRHQIKPGIIALAAKTACPILPMGAIAEKTWVLKKTWDQFRVPKPFSRVRIVYGEPIMLEADDMQEGRYEAVQSRLAESLHQIERSAWTDC